MIPGKYHVKSSQIALNTGRATCRVAVEDHGGRPIQVSSHYHFAEVSSALKLDRQQVTGYRLNIPVGTAICSESGQKREVKLVAPIDHRIIFDFHGEVMGPLEADDE